MHRPVVSAPIALLLVPIGTASTQQSMILRTFRMLDVVQARYDHTGCGLVIADGKIHSVTARDVRLVPRSILAIVLLSVCDSRSAESRRTATLNAADLLGATDTSV